MACSRELTLENTAMAFDLACSSHLLEQVLHEVLRFPVEGVGDGPEVLQHRGLSFVEDLGHGHYEPFLWAFCIGHFLHSPVEAGEIIIQLGHQLLYLFAARLHNDLNRRGQLVACSGQSDLGIGQELGGHA